MSQEDLMELKFRLYDGSDIGPFRYSPASTVAMLKERIVAEWPKALACWLRQKTSFSGLNENVHHEGQPMPGEEQEDILMTTTQSNILKTKCPLTGKHVIELVELVLKAPKLSLIEESHKRKMKH